MSPHAPSAPSPFNAAVHAWHTPPQSVSQHTPSTQMPLAHCDAVTQAAPFAWSGLQVPVAMSQ
jgi:hypothetical protein